MAQVLHLPPAHGLPMQKVGISLCRDEMEWAFVVWCSVSGCRWHVPALDLGDAMSVLEEHLTRTHGEGHTRMDSSN